MHIHYYLKNIDRHTLRTMNVSNLLAYFKEKMFTKLQQATVTCDIIYLLKQVTNRIFYSVGELLVRLKKMLCGR